MHMLVLYKYLTYSTVFQVSTLQRRKKETENTRD